MNSRRHNDVRRGQCDGAPSTAMFATCHGSLGQNFNNGNNAMESESNRIPKSLILGGLG